MFDFSGELAAMKHIADKIELAMFKHANGMKETFKDIQAFGVKMKKIWAVAPASITKGIVSERTDNDRAKPGRKPHRDKQGSNSAHVSAAKGSK